MTADDDPRTLEEVVRDLNAYVDDYIRSGNSFSAGLMEDAVTVIEEQVAEIDQLRVELDEMKRAWQDRDNAAAIYKVTTVFYREMVKRLTACA